MKSFIEKAIGRSLKHDDSDEWEECVVDSDYEINVNYPYQIRRKSNKRVVSEHVLNSGYIQCTLNDERFLKHRIIAFQWIPNDDPDPWWSRRCWQGIS